MKMTALKNIIAVFAICTYISAVANDIKTYEINVGEFTELKVTDGIRVDYRMSEDSCGYAVFNATPQMASVIMASLNKNCLTLQLSSDGKSKTDIPHITVYSRFLQKVENEGDSLVKVINPVPVPVFRAKLVGNGQISVHGVSTNALDVSLTTGNGTLLLNGVTTQAKYNLLGSGSIQCADLKANDVKCKMMGTGYVECWAVERLSVLGAGSGKVYYQGHPAELKNNSIGVKVLPIE